MPPAQVEQWQKVLEELLDSLNALELLFFAQGGLIPREYLKSLGKVNPNDLFWSPLIGQGEDPLIEMGLTQAEVSEAEMEIGLNDVDLYFDIFQHYEMDAQLYIAYFWLLAEKKGDELAASALVRLIVFLVTEYSQSMPQISPVSKVRNMVRESANVPDEEGDIASRTVAYFSDPENVKKMASKIIAARPKP